MSDMTKVPENTHAIDCNIGTFIGKCTCGATRLPCSCGAGVHDGMTCDIAARNAIAAAREEGHAAGYAEAIERAAKVAEAEYDRLYRSHRDADLPGMEAARSIENAIRALAPAKEEPK